MPRQHSPTPTAVRASMAAHLVRGFTLIEILVVIVIISIIISAATIAVGVLGGDRQAEDQARRLWAVLQQAREEAELQGLDAGLYMAASAYEFLRFQPRANQWQPIPEDPLYAPREMPPGLRFRATLDGREIVLQPALVSRVVKPIRQLKDEVKELGADDEDRKKDPRKKDEKDNPSPQIVVLSSGEIMPFEIAIERDNAPALWRVVGTAENDLRVEQRDAEQRWQIILQTNQADEEEDEKEKSRARK
jgi:general secretion pathway protein H